MKSLATFHESVFVDKVAITFSLHLLAQVIVQTGFGWIIISIENTWSMGRRIFYNMCSLQESKTKTGFCGGCVMKQDKKEKRNNILYSVLGFVLGIAMCGIGIYGMILNRIESQEYKNTTDKREVIAVVESCREIDNSDDKDKNKKNSRSVKYRTKLAFEVDGKAYEGEETYNQKVYVGDKVKVEVYRTSKGIYKLRPYNNLVNFVFYCVAIPLRLYHCNSLCLQYRADRQKKKNKIIGFRNAPYWAGM